jgi:two-component system response regulator MprA
MTDKQPEAPWRILVVDDEPALRDFLERGLTRHGMEVLVACDGHAALHVLKTESVDCILLDLVMPAMEGLTLLQELERSGYRGPRIAMSGAFGGEYVAVARALGANRCLEKPIRIEELVETLRGLLNGR